MKVRTDIKAGGVQVNHNESLSQDNKVSESLKVKTGIKTGGIGTSPTVTNHNETLANS
jgi:hypothetical protein